MKLDDVYLSGEKSGKPGPGLTHKIVLVAAIQTSEDDLSLFVRFKRLPGFKGGQRCLGQSSLGLCRPSFPG